MSQNVSPTFLAARNLLRALSYFLHVLSKMLSQLLVDFNHYRNSAFALSGKTQKHVIASILLQICSWSSCLPKTVRWKRRRMRC